MGMQLFENPEFGRIRTIEVEGRVLFCAKDVCSALGYANSSKAISDHCKGVTKRYPIVDQLGRTQQAVFIEEPDVFRLIVSSKLPNAQRFEAWVFEQILPSVRQHGAYIADQESLSDDELMARALQASQRIIEAKQARIDALEPKALFADAVGSSDTLILIRDLAHLLRQNGIDTGEKRLFTWMREHCYLEKHRNEPTQMALKLGVLKVVENAIVKPDGSQIITRTPKVTGKGQEYFLRKFLEKTA